MSGTDETGPEIKIEYLGGNCPVQAEGTINGLEFYFRARGRHWSIGIGGEPIGDPAWYYEEEYSPEPFAAGWMARDEAMGFIKQAANRYAKEKTKP